jgi:hypothetical protein
MLGEPFRGIVLTPHQAGLQRKILDGALLGARGRRTLQAEDEHKRGQWIFLSRDHDGSGSAAIMIRIFWVIGLVTFALVAGPAYAAGNDYPTSARADYVIGCMAANGNTREAMLKCACAIDTIASLMPFSHYEQADTALGLQAGGGVGGRVGLFRDPPQIKAVIEELHRAQAEANLQCQ